MSDDQGEEKCKRDAAVHTFFVVDPDSALSPSDQKAELILAGVP